MGGHTFLKLSGISGGGATDGEHPGCFEISSFRSGVTNVEDDLKDVNEESSGPEIDLISFEKLTDKSSPKFAHSACTGRSVGTGTIYFSRPTGKMQPSKGLEDFMEIKLENVVIKKYELSGGGEYPSDSIDIGFTSIEWCYKDGNVTEKWTLSDSK